LGRGTSFETSDGTSIPADDDDDAKADEGQFEE